MSERRAAFWSQQPGLVWSNPAASDAVMVRAALLRPRFQQLLEVAKEFGLPVLRREWEILTAGGENIVLSARPTVERILRNIELGFARAAACH